MGYIVIWLFCILAVTMTLIVLVSGSLGTCITWCDTFDNTLTASVVDWSSYWLMIAVCQVLQAGRTSVGASQKAHWAAVVCLCIVWQAIHTQFSSDAAHAHSYRRKTIHVCNVWLAVHTALPACSPSANTHWWTFEFNVLEFKSSFKVMKWAACRVFIL